MPRGWKLKQISLPIDEFQRSSKNCIGIKITMETEIMVIQTFRNNEHCSISSFHLAPSLILLLPRFWDPGCSRVLWNFSLRDLAQKEACLFCFLYIVTGVGRKHKYWIVIPHWLLNGFDQLLWFVKNTGMHWKWFTETVFTKTNKLCMN